MMENIYSIKRVFSQYGVMVHWVISGEKKFYIEVHSKVRKDL